MEVTLITTGEFPSGPAGQAVPRQERDFRGGFLSTLPKIALATAKSPKVSPQYLGTAGSVWCPRLEPQTGTEKGSI